MKIYMDNCCFNRPFDDQSRIRIRPESEAKLKIQEEIRSGKLQLVWSYILDYENHKNPYQERKIRIKGWNKYAVLNIGESPIIIKTAQALGEKGFGKIDSLHIACAIFAECEFFLTTDDKILKLSELVKDIRVNDPIGFIKEIIT